MAVAYHRLVALGKIRRDQDQLDLAAALDQLVVALTIKQRKHKLFPLRRFLAGKNGPPESETKNGLYIWGSVGSGKTMMMDLFFASAPLEKKRRQHFHVFMADVHARIFASRTAYEPAGKRDPIGDIARALAAEAALLCLDEFMVTDIADAMILRRLFTKLFDHGVILVTTSNTAPDDLYAGGLNRTHFLPFIALLKQKIRIFPLHGTIDYRLQQKEPEEVYLTPLGPDTDRAMDRLWLQFTHTEKGVARQLLVHGHLLDVPESMGTTARFTFADLCEKPLGAHDFQEITREFRTILIDRIPYLAVENRNIVRRFIVLIDHLYDAGITLIASAADEPDRLYPIHSGAEGRDYIRTASRLVEMRSKAYRAGSPKAFFRDPSP